MTHLSNMGKGQFVEAVARETARMSWPGQMGRILKAGTKKAVEEFFVCKATTEPWMRIWTDPTLPAGFDRWHKDLTSQLGEALKDGGHIKARRKNGAEYNPVAVATKLLNTYLHQLMKYEQPRRCYRVLHVPLDQTIRRALVKELADKQCSDAAELLRKNNPYTLEYEQYFRIQIALREHCKKLSGPEYIHPKFVGIELNLLWASVGS